MARTAATRKPGRPSQPATGPDRRERILDIAAELFGKQGVAATSMSAIAKKAKITPALMHYYFGTREKLLDALVAERMRPAIAEVSERMLAAENDLSGLVHAFVRTTIQAVASRPWFPPLWVREVLSDGGTLRERMVDGVGLALMVPLRNRFAAAQAQGRLNRDLDPSLLVVTLISLTMFPFASQSIWRSRLNADHVCAKTITLHALALLDRGLELTE